MTVLDTRLINDLKLIFAAYPELERAVVFGSYAKGTATERSDIDVALCGSALNRFVVADIALSIDDSDITVDVDLQNYADIKNAALREHIDRVGIQVYP